MGVSGREVEVGVMVKVAVARGFGAVQDVTMMNVSMRSAILFMFSSLTK